MDNLNLLANTTVAMLKKDPIEVPTNQVLCNSPIDILKTLDTYGVAVIALQCDNKKLLKAIKDTKFYNTANAIFKDEFKVPEPTMEEKLNPKKYKKRKAGDDAQICYINMELLFIP